MHRKLQLLNSLLLPCMGHQMYWLMLRCCTSLIRCKPVKNSICRYKPPQVLDLCIEPYSKNEQSRTFCTIERALELLHWPWLKLPQVPRGVPKLANLIEEMTWLGKGHSNDRTGPAFLSASEFELHISTGNGWDSDTCEHKLVLCFVAKAIWVGSPPISSNNTRVLPLDSTHERGTWYLQHY